MKKRQVKDIYFYEVKQIWKHKPMFSFVLCGGPGTDDNCNCNCPCDCVGPGTPDHCDCNCNCKCNCN